MTLDAIFTQFRAQRERTATLEVRHVGAFVSTRTRLTLEQLAARKPLATTHDHAAIRDAFDAVEAAEPKPTADQSESRWQLSFLNAESAPLLVVTTAIFAPRHGTIDGNKVLFGNDRLVHWLTEHFAPSELSAISR